MDDIYALRRDRLRALLRRKGLDAVLIRYAANRFYLSGFELHDTQLNESSGSLIISADGRDWLVTDPRYEAEAGRLWPSENIAIYRHDSTRELSRLLRMSGIRIGLETETTGHAFAGKLASCSTGLSFEAADGLVESLREIKDAGETAAIEASFALNHTLLLWLEKELRPGATEAEISWKIERFFRENGASELAFASIVAVDANAAKPHAIAGDTRLHEDCLVLVDVGCRVQNYCSDQTRTFWVGEHPSERFAETVELVRRAQREAIAMMRPGVVMSDVYRKAVQVFESEGKAKAFTHGLGHGVGLETHEKPSLSSRCDEVLREGMVVTVEPGLYYPDWGGVRWEHTVLVVEDGVRVL